MFNAGFDILNSRSVRYFAEATCNDKIDQIIAFTDLITNYIKGLKVKEKVKFVPILDSNRQMEFFGFIECSNSALVLYGSFIKSNKIDHIKIYEMNQDHLEIFLEQYEDWEVLIITLHLDNSTPLTKNWFYIQLTLNISI